MRVEESHVWVSDSQHRQQGRGDGPTWCICVSRDRERSFLEHPNEPVTGADEGGMPLPDTCVKVDDNLSIHARFYLYFLLNREGKGVPGFWIENVSARTQANTEVAVLT